MKKHELTQATLHAEISYDPRTGEFTRRTARGGTKIGDKCGYVGKNGYCYLSVCNHEYLAHRLAWLYMHGEWPQRDIDHINRNPLDNRIANLRDVSAVENGRNCKTHSDNTSGYPGVYWFKPLGNWTAMVFYKGKCISLGYFKTREAAWEARLAGEREHYGIDRRTVP